MTKPLASRPQRDAELRRLLIRRPYASLQRARDHSCFLLFARKSLERANILFRPRLKLHCLLCHSHSPNHKVGVQRYCLISNTTPTVVAKRVLWITAGGSERVLCATATTLNSENANFMSPRCHTELMLPPSWHVKGMPVRIKQGSHSCESRFSIRPLPTRHQMILY